MYSILKHDFVYDDVSGDITETDIDVVSDLWSMDGRNVYRGSRDPRYTHANVYWLYDEDLQRVGCSEHDVNDHAVFHLLWFQDSDFGTLLQEEGWKQDGDFWGKLPQRTFDRFLNEGWTDPISILEQCLEGPTRIVTPEMIQRPLAVYSCAKCGRRSLTRGKNCLGAVAEPLSFPQRDSVLFVDSDLVTYRPPLGSSVWSRLGLPCDDLPLPSQAQEPEPEQEPREGGTLQSEESQPPPHATPRRASPESHLQPSE